MVGALISFGYFVDGELSGLVRVVGDPEMAYMKTFYRVRGINQ